MIEKIIVYDADRIEVVFLFDDELKNLLEMQKGKEASYAG